MPIFSRFALQQSTGTYLKKGPVWTVEFNRHGTRMATGGQDGRVVVWNVSVPGNDADSILDQIHSARENDPKNVSKQQEGNASSSRAHEELNGGEGLRTGKAVNRTASESAASSASASSDDLGCSSSAGRASGSLRGADGSERAFSGLKVCTVPTTFDQYNFYYDNIGSVQCLLYYKCLYDY